jgi:hypothetical protein
MLGRAIYKEDDLKSKFVSGYMQDLSLYPFTIHMYSEDQLRILCDHIRAGDAYLYFDSTGTVVGKIPTQDKHVFYYPLVLKSRVKGQPVIPVAEMLSNSHTSGDISNFLFRVSKCMNSIKPGIGPPKKIEIDFSWAMIHGVLLGINNETVLSYLARQWNFLHDKNIAQNESKCVIHLCAAHTMHSFGRKLASCTNDKGLKQFFHYCFGILQNCTLLSEMKVFFDICASYA